MKVSRDEGVIILEKAKEQLEKTAEKADVMKLLAFAGASVGYAPAFRALVMEVAPDQAIRWS